MLMLLLKEITATRLSRNPPARRQRASLRGSLVDELMFRTFGMARTHTIEAGGKVFTTRMLGKLLHSRWISENRHQLHTTWGHHRWKAICRMSSRTAAATQQQTALSHQDTEVPYKTSNRGWHQALAFNAVEAILPALAPSKGNPLEKRYSQETMLSIKRRLQQNHQFQRERLIRTQRRLSLVFAYLQHIRRNLAQRHDKMVRKLPTFPSETMKKGDAMDELEALRTAIIRLTEHVYVMTALRTRQPVGRRE
ncbi:hypothetical protein CYMTET_46644 [Cymbomonas tetramitiformis]|uniref:Uncharacterized protein n=1 Tax=Cymbomonas tetramitiformis TaxID=36881 RepID=A0AAE0BXK0_9CHLO|nr:hypothetical protein CYMTET_46644 [Cymbomonas tetramitiformis]